MFFFDFETFILFQGHQKFLRNDLYWSTNMEKYLQITHLKNSSISKYTGPLIQNKFDMSWGDKSVVRHVCSGKAGVVFLHIVKFTGFLKC